MTRHNRDRHNGLCALQPRRYNRKRLSIEVLKLKRDTTRRKWTDINSEIEVWYNSTTALAQRLAERYHHSPRYILDRMYHRGTRVNRHTKTNAYNAWASLKTANLNAGAGDQVWNIMDVRREFDEEYANLSPQEKEELVKEFDRRRDDTPKGYRVGAASKLMDFKHTYQLLEEIMSSMTTRVGGHGFFCIFRGTTAFKSDPRWYFSNEGMESYLKFVVRKGWNTMNIGTQLEVFAIAACNPLSLLKNKPQKAEFLKKQIHDLLGEKLCKITNDPLACMSYIQYVENIVNKYDVKLVGWTHQHFKSPSTLGSGIPELQKLYDALVDGSCGFERLTPVTKKRHLAKYAELVASGKRPGPQPRKKSSKKRKRALGGSESQDEDDEDEQTAPRKRQPKSAELVDSSDEDE